MPSDDLKASGSFDDFDLPDAVRQALRDMAYETPTPVQKAVFSQCVAGSDMVVQARTGTGKTTAFGLPLVARLSDKRAAPSKPEALILCPTRELALQVSREIDKLAAGSDVSIVAVYGGAPMQKQIDALEAGAAIVAGTPGRVLDHMRRGTLDPEALTSFVLDECDEMLSMGFLPQITEIWEQLPQSVQVLLFSATVPREVVRIAETRLKEPEFLALSGDQIGALEIEHFVYLSQGDRFRELLQLVEVEDPESAIIFCNTREDTKRAAGVLQKAGYSADWLNADLSQKDREKVMQATRDSKLRFLVCTDVAARGIDISHLTHVINFDFPDSPEQYVHRTGRTGRAGRMGTAISLVGAGAIGNLYHLRLLYKIRPIERQLPSSAEVRTRKEADVIALLENEVAAPAPSKDDLALARRLLTHDNVENIVAGMLRARFGPQGAEDKASQARREKMPAPVSSEEDPQSSPPERPESAKRKKRARPEDGTSPDRERSSSAPGKRSRGKRRPTEYREEDGVGYHVSDLPEGQQDKGENDGGAVASAPADAKQAPDANAAEIYVNVGRRDGAKPGAFRTVLADAGVTDDSVSYVNVRQNHTFVGVSKDELETALSALNGAVIADRQATAEPARSKRAS